MSWFIRVSRYLSVHMIYAQEMPNSCGMASIMMVNFKQKRDTMMTGLAAGAQLNNLPLVGPAAGQALMKAAIDYAVKSEPEVYKEYTKVTGSPYDGSGYSDCLFFPKVLKNLGLGEWEAVYVGPTGFSAAAKAASEAASGDVMISRCACDASARTTLSSSVSCIADRMRLHSSATTLSGS